MPAEQGSGRGERGGEGPAAALCHGPSAIFNLLSSLPCPHLYTLLIPIEMFKKVSNSRMPKETPLYEHIARKFPSINW